MIQLEIKPQPRLSIRELCAMTLTTQRYRIFRSFITILVVTVATAFLVNLTLTSIISRSLAASTEAELLEYRKASALVSELTRDWTAEAILRDFAEGNRGSKVDIWPVAQSELLTPHKAREVVRFIDLFEQQSSRTLKGLGMGQNPFEIFSASQEILSTSGIQELQAKFAGIDGAMDLQAFASLLQGWGRILATVQEIAEERTKVVIGMNQHFAGENPVKFFTGNSESIRNALVSSGADLSRVNLQSVIESAKSEIEISSLEQAFSRPGARRILSGMLNQKLEDVDPTMAWFLFVEKENITTFNSLLNSLEVGEEDLDVDRVLSATARASAIKVRERVLRSVQAGGLADEGASFRLGLLLGISLFVCVVGVANALLMSVTERSREIATLKCLGALDVSILALFVLEATIVGIVGGALGAVLGLFLAAFRLLGDFGTYVIGFISLNVVAMAILGSILLGMLLATCASVYPSLRAARLAPMEAMRVE